jgi:hypothetical protein
MLIVQLLSPLFLPLIALAAEKPALCGLTGNSIVGRSASGVAQVSNLGDIEIRCSIPARPFPLRPGESRNGLRSSVTTHKISPDGSKELEWLASEAHVTGGGFDRGDSPQEWVIFYVHIPLESAELDAEANRYLAKLETARGQQPMPTAPLTEEERRRALANIRSLVYQHRDGRFLIECHVMDRDQVMGVGKVELEVLFKGRFSDAGLSGAPPV